MGHFLTNNILKIVNMTALFCLILNYAQVQASEDNKKHTKCSWSFQHTQDNKRQQLDIKELLAQPLEALMGLEIKKVQLASGTTEEVKQAPAVVSIIKAEDIEAMGASDLDEVLESVPGLHVAYSHTSYNPIYVIRGMYSNLNSELLFLINGIPQRNITLGNRSQAWGGMPVNSIARIEIIRGSGSALYGADAFAGVINVITKNYQEINGNEVGVRGGSFETGYGWWLHGGEYGGFNVGLTAEVHTTEGHGEILSRDGQTLDDARFNTNASLAPAPVQLQREGADVHLNIEKGNWRFQGMYQGRYGLGMGSGSDNRVDVTGEASDNRVGLNLSHCFETDNHWAITSELNYGHQAYNTTDQMVLPPGSLGGYFPNGFIMNLGTKESNFYTKVSGFYDGWKDHLLYMGAGFNYDNFYEVKSVSNVFVDENGNIIPLPAGQFLDYSNTPLAFLPEGDRQYWFAFLQDTWSLSKDWKLTLGLRYDDYSEFSSVLSPRAVVLWQIKDNLILKFLYGRAFRSPPSFSELYESANVPLFSTSNNQLRLESLDSYEIATDYRISNSLNFKGNIFYYQRNDVIRQLPNAEGEQRLQNAGHYRGHGLELEMDWKATPELFFTANYAWQEVEDQLLNANPGNAPHHQLYIRSHWLFKPEWSLGTQFNWVMDRERLAREKAISPKIANYHLIDLTLRYKPAKDRLNLALGVRNVLDKQAFEPVPFGLRVSPYDLPLAGRSLFFELRSSF